LNDDLGNDPLLQVKVTAFEPQERHNVGNVEEVLQAVGVGHGSKVQIPKHEVQVGKLAEVIREPQPQPQSRPRPDR